MFIGNTVSKSSWKGTQYEEENEGGASFVQVVWRNSEWEWLEELRRRNQAIALLRAWRDGDAKEQKDTLEYLKESLDRDRHSFRKLFS